LSTVLEDVLNNSRTILSESAHSELYELNLYEAIYTQNFTGSELFLKFMDLHITPVFLF